MNLIPYLFLLLPIHHHNIVSIQVVPERFNVVRCGTVSHWTVDPPTKINVIGPMRADFPEMIKGVSYFIGAYGQNSVCAGFITVKR